MARSHIRKRYGVISGNKSRITSYNVCYTKLLRLEEAEAELNRVNARLEEKKQEDIIRQSYESKLSSDRYRP